MQLEVIGYNMTVITLSNDNKYLFSYSTPVAKIVANTLFVTNVKHSNTTSKHISKLMKMLGYKSHEKTFTYPDIIAREINEI